MQNDIMNIMRCDLDGEKGSSNGGRNNVASLTVLTALAENKTTRRFSQNNIPSNIINRWLGIVQIRYSMRKGLLNEQIWLLPARAETKKECAAKSVANGLKLRLRDHKCAVGAPGRTYEIEGRHRVENRRDCFVL